MTRQTLIVIAMSVAVVVAVWIFMQPTGNSGAEPDQPPPHAIDQSD